MNTPAPVATENNIKSSNNKPSISNEHAKVFTGFGRIETENRIHLKPDAVPYMCAPQSVAHAIRDKLKAKLDRLVPLDVNTESNEAHAWLNLIVPVLKTDGSLTICLEPLELNKATVRDRYSMPNIRHI